MRVLAIESSAVTASVAIVTDDLLTAEYTINYKKTHSQTLLPMIEEICNMTEMDTSTFDLIAVSVGPGSFTGLRIGAATGKGLALALNKKMVAVPTLEGMAYNLYGTDKLICPIMDAKRQHLYTGIYTFEHNVSEQTSEGQQDQLHVVQDQSLLSYEELADKLNELNREVIFVGDGITVAADVLKQKLTCAYSFAPAQMRTQRAGSVAVAAIQMAGRGEVITAEALRPDYLRPSQAERERMAKQ